MPYKDRKALIRKIQEELDSKLICYILSDRKAIPFGPEAPGMSLSISQEDKEIMYSCLQGIGWHRNLDLFIYTRGGDTNAIWPIVSLLREFCQSLRVLVPFRCHSGGTMICLGANSIIMSRMGELSPIDPTTGNRFNPLDEQSPGTRKGISVEDVTSYLELAKDKTKFALGSTAILDVFKQLTNAVHPLALGNVNRVHSQIRLLSKELLSLHLGKNRQSSRIKKITDRLTREFYSHLHFINRNEAAGILGKSILQYPDEKLETMMMDLYHQYSNSLQMRHDFCCVTEMGSEQNKRFDLCNGFIESELTSFAHVVNLTMTMRSEVPPNIHINLQPGQPTPPIIPGLPKTFSLDLLGTGWVKNEGGL